ncbi:tetratricopeptide repeat-containing sensor histidine kinase [Anditalea andensis]|uniref:histidine kinase n=1 Tax=Anditalea andensis TaxID=1048983 RepID=A0A074L332_9BACT|nr:tetratricopeptide repeat protein [Anditalea andensis]KEO75584.1 hypothetical protein EL17_00385 [Anditalea andensis]
MNRIFLSTLLVLISLSVFHLRAQSLDFTHQFVYAFDPSEIALERYEIDHISERIFDFKGHHLDSMLYLSEKILLGSRAISYNKGMANSYSYIGVYHYQKGNYTQAVKYYIRAQELWMQEKDNNKVASLSNNIGLVYEQLEDITNSLYYHQLAIDQSDGQQSPIVLANFYLNYANVKNLHTNIYDALPYYYKAIAMLQAEKNIDDLANVYLNLGNTFGRHGMIDSVKVYFDKGLHLARKGKDYTNLAYALTSQIRFYTYTEDYSEALKYANESLEAANISKSTQTKADALFAISDLYELLGDYKESLSAARQYQAVVDTLNKQTHNLEIARIEASSLFEKEKLLLDKQIVDQETLAFRRLFIISILIVFICLLFLTAYFIYRNGRKARKANLLLIRKNKEIEVLAAQSAELSAHQQIIFKILGHDLKGPVLSLATVTEMASNDYFSLEELKALLPRLSVQAKQLNVSLENLLHWAMNQMTGERWEPAYVNLTGHVQECIDFLDTAIREKSISVHLHLENFPNLYADPYMMMIGIRNVIANAIKFTPEGEIISISSSKKDDMMGLMIFNPGKEISPEILRKINDGLIVSESQRGTGLGLMLTRKYMLKNKGRMEVRNITGEGVEVGLFLPLQ